MNPGEIYAKTDNGARELKERKLNLPIALRSVLIMIDGNRTVGEVLERARALRVDASAFSELERAIPAVSQKVLTQQLRQLERDGIVRRVVYPQVPPKVEYALTDWGQALCPVLDALLKWSATRATPPAP